MRKDYKTHVSQKKKESVDEFKKLIKQYPIVGVINVQNLPSAQLNKLRKKLRGSGVLIKMTKSSVLRLALDASKDAKKGIEQLEGYLAGMPSLLFTKDNPFSLFKLIKKSKSKAAAKAGQSAPSDIVVNAGPTSFAPGPIISELASVGIKTKVEQGKLVIQQDSVVAKAGTVISDKLASMLMRLGIEPMEIGLDLVAIYENGTVFTKSVLDIDEDKFMQDMGDAARWALNLSVEVAFPVKDNIELLLGKAARETKAVAMESSFVCSDTVGDMMGKAEAQMLSVKSALGM